MLAKSPSPTTARAAFHTRQARSRVVTKSVKTPLQPSNDPARQPRTDDPQKHGEVAEWSIAPVSKTGVGASLPWVRIPPSPPYII